MLITPEDWRDQSASKAKRMRVAYYTRPAFLFHSLGLVRAMSRYLAVHLLLEISPEERAAGSFGEDTLVA